MDVYAQICLATPTHDLSFDPAKAARRMTLGDVVGVGEATRVAYLLGGDYYPIDPFGNTKNPLGFVFIKGFPDENLGMLTLLTQGDYDYTDPAKPVLLRKNKWGVNTQNIPLAVRNKLLQDRYINVTWAQVKDYIRNVRANVLLTDSDL